MFAASTNSPSGIAIAYVVQRIHTSEVTCAFGPAHDLALLPRFRLSVLPVAPGMRDGVRGLAPRITQVGLSRVITDLQRLACFAFVASIALDHELHVPAPPAPQRVLAAPRWHQRVGVRVAPPPPQLLQP